VFWPFDLMLRGAEYLWRSLVALLRGGPDKPLMGRVAVRRTGAGARLLVLLPIMIFVLFPFFWVIITSFKTTPQISQRTSIFWPSPFTLDQYWSLVQRTPFLTWFRNSVIVAAISTVISVALASLGAYALSRLKFLGAGALTTFLLITYLLPGTLLFIPLYQVVTYLGLADTIWGLGVVYPTITVPFCTWLLLGFFRSIPKELDEAAMIDGCSRWRAFLRVALPLAAPGYAAAAILAFAHTVGEFGVVLMIGGGIPGVTNVLSVEIFRDVEALEWGRAHMLAALVLLFSFAVVLSLLRSDRRLDVKNHSQT
jgi:multiple sugar transport system permease protein